MEHHIHYFENFYQKCLLDVQQWRSGVQNFSNNVLKTKMPPDSSEGIAAYL
jgi:hypothetical protein